ncbi:MAG: TRL domain-containing protein, partial [Myxococcales bacterium]
SMKSLKAAVLAAVAMSLSGCASIAFAGMGVPNAALYVDAAQNVKVTQNALGGKTSPEQCMTSILGIVTTGNASVGTAAKMAGITQVAVVDARYTDILGLFAKYCIVVHGE